MRRIRVEIKTGKDKRWYCIIRSSNGEIMWITPRGYARTHHANKPILTIARCFFLGKFEVVTQRSTAKDRAAIAEAQAAVGRVK
jgi:hypothetical protein